MAATSDGTRSRRARRRSVSRRFRPQSIRTRVARESSRASTSVQLPLLPLPRDAKRSTSQEHPATAGLFQLLVEERKDALRGFRVFRGAVLVQDVDQACFLVLAHLNAVLLGL